MATVPELLEIDFVAQFRLPTPAAYAARRISVADSELERRQAIAWAAEQLGRMLGVVVQADRHAVGAGTLLAPDANALRWVPHDDPFLREIELPWAGAAGLLRLADETTPDEPVPRMLKRIRHLARAVDPLARYRLIVLEETRRGVTPGWVFMGPGPALPVWLRGLAADHPLPVGVPTLIDPRDGRFLTLAPYLRYHLRPRRLDLFLDTETNQARYQAVDGSVAYLTPVPTDETPRRGEVTLSPGDAHLLADPVCALDDGALFADDYRILGWMARGGVAEIYLARNRDTGQLSAIKLFVSEDNYFDRNLMRFIEEGNLRGRIDSNDVVRIFRTGVEGNHRYMEMEYLPGGDLEEQMNRTGPLPPSRAVAIAVELTRALEAIHDAGVVHRDIKPGNVMFSWERASRLIDLGIARKMDPPAHKGGSTGRLGTEGYMAPEQVRGRRVDRRTDVFGVGVLLHEMITGQRPDQVDDRAARGPALPRGLVPTVARCLAFAPEQRFADMATLRSALRRWQRSGRRDAVAISLDLEGTILTNALEAQPRPGLGTFLDWCGRRFDRLFVYTCVDERRATDILAELVYEGVIGADVADRMEYVAWSRGYDGARKDLRRCAFPVERNVILDDMRMWIVPDQRHRWIEAPDYNEVDPTDRFLTVVPRRIERLFPGGLRDG